MAARAFALRFVTRAGASQGPATARRAVVTFSGQKFYHATPSQWQPATTTQSKPPGGAGDPIAASMAKSTTPTGNETTDDAAKNAAFLGEADSDDGFEADIEINPDAHRHKFDDVGASGLHGQAGEGDEPIERERRPLEAIDASQAAFLGEADSDDAHESDRELNPEKYRHRIDETQHAAFLGEADSNDAHETDRDLNPDKYRHNIDDASSSGIHGQAGEGDESLEK